METYFKNIDWTATGLLAGAIGFPVIMECIVRVLANGMKKRIKRGDTPL